MKALFTAVSTKLDTIPAINWTDQDKGQTDNNDLRPGLKFPAALITVSFPTFEEQGGGGKLITASIVIRLVFDGTNGKTNSTAPAEAKARSLAYMDTTDAVYEAFRKYEPDEWVAFETREYVQEKRSDGLVVMRLTYASLKFDF